MQSQGLYSKIWLPSLNIKGSKILASLPRADLGLAIQMLSGHNRLNRHENLCTPEVSLQKVRGGGGIFMAYNSPLPCSCPQERAKL